MGVCVGGSVGGGTDEIEGPEEVDGATLGSGEGATVRVGESLGILVASEKVGPGLTVGA